MSAIDVMRAQTVTCRMSVWLLCSLALVAVLAAGPGPSFAAGQAASGELLHYPCSSCHPVTPGSRDALPVDFEGHQVVLIGHDALGDGSSACAVCHGDPGGDPGALNVVDGTTVQVNGDVSRVCFGCHSVQYREWEVGAHGRGEPSCTSAGCHDPHTPAWIYGEPLPPFTGTGFEVRVVSEREPFTPLAGPPVKAPTVTPGWLVLATGVAFVFSAGVVGYLIRGRSAR